MLALQICLGLLAITAGFHGLGAVLESRRTREFQALAAKLAKEAAAQSGRRQS